MPVRDVVEAPEVEAVADTVVSETVAPVEVVSEAPPCQKIVDLVCELGGRFTDMCRDAKSAVPDDTHPETRDACLELYTRFEKDELPRVGSACTRYAREVCRTLGEGSESCKTAKGQVQVLTSRRELRACLGDLLWSYTRTFRR